MTLAVEGIERVDEASMVIYCGLNILYIGTYIITFHIFSLLKQDSDRPGVHLYGLDRPESETSRKHHQIPNVSTTIFSNRTESTTIHFP